MPEVPVHLFNNLKNVIDSYTNEISPYQAFTDEIYQNFFDAAKEYINGCKEQQKDSEPSELTIEIDKTNKKMTIHQKGTTGVQNQEEYYTYSLTSKSKESLSAGSRGIGWKIWQFICERVETETIFNNEYYQMIHSTDFKNKKLIYEKWTKNEQYFKKTISKNGETVIKFINIEMKKGYNEDSDENFFDEISKSWERILQERYFQILTKYPSIKVFLKENNKENRELQPKPFPEVLSGLTELKTPKMKLSDTNTVENLLISYSIENTSAKYQYSGIAIIVRDRVVERFYPNKLSRLNLPGQLYGYIECNDLYLKDNQTHDSLNRNHRDVKKTHDFLKSNINDYIERIDSLNLPDQFNLESQSSLLSKLNRILTNLIQDSSPYDIGTGDNRLEGDLNEPSDEIEKELKIKIAEIQISPNSANLSRDETYNFGIKIDNSIGRPYRVKLELNSRLKKYSKKIYLNPGFNSRIIPIKIPHKTRLGACNFSFKLKDNRNLKILHKKNLLKLIDPIITNILFPKSGNLDENYNLSFEIYHFNVSFEGKIIINLTNPTEEENIYTKEINISPGKEVNEEVDFIIPISSSQLRGKYTLEIKVVNKYQEIIQKELNFIHIQEYLKSINLSDKLANYNEPIKIKSVLINPTNDFLENCEFSLILENLEFHKEIIFEQTINIKPNTDLFPIETEFQFKLECLPGKYLIKAKLRSDDDYIEEKSRNLYLDEVPDEYEDSGGILSRIDYNKSINTKDDSAIAYRNSEGEIKINTFHYLFSKIENEKGLDLKRFKEMIIRAIWESIKDQIQDEDKFQEPWQFEEYLFKKGI